METEAIVVGAATVLSTFQLLPQVTRSHRLRSTVGLSPVWAMIGAIVNIGWFSYRSAQELWLSLPSPVVSAVLYLVLLQLVLRATPRRIGTYLAAVGAVTTLGLAALLGGWRLVGMALGVWAGIQVAPAVWHVFRTEGALAIAPGLWLVGLGQALCWGYYGSAVGDSALLIYGVAMGLGSAAILLRFAWVGGSPEAEQGFGVAVPAITRVSQPVSQSS